MSEATHSPVLYLTLVVFTFVLAAMVISFAVTLNWVFLGGAVPAAAMVAFVGRKVIG